MFCVFVAMVTADGAVVMATIEQLAALVGLGRILLVDAEGIAWVMIFMPTTQGQPGQRSTRSEVDQVKANNKTNSKVLTSTHSCM